MSKIDEISHKIHILLNEEISWDDEQIFCITQIDLLLEQLRPYVELTEEFMNQMQYATYPNHPDYPEELTIRDHVFLNKYKKLIQQIKEQSNADII